jgi:thiosulfate/3-mercaptopyruvate sulfurtransferase
MPWLINAAQLDKFRKNQKTLIILDASWHMPGEQDAQEEFALKHIAGAQFFPIDIFSDTSDDAPHPHMVINDEKIISEKLSQLGIRNDYKIIFYDNSKLHTSCRALWMMKYFGHNPQLLYILDGGLQAGATYTLQPRLLRDLTSMQQNLQDHTEQVVDVRHAVRYAGGAELKAGVRCGHIPGSYSFPYTTMFDKNGYWRPLEKIRQQFSGISADVNAPVISTCGSGITAPVMNFALDLLGNGQNAVYNGSWNEWGTEKLLAGETDLSARPVQTSVEEN